MALLPIIQYPDPRLHTVAAEVRMVDDRVRRLVDDMAQTMYAAPGVGLAATQVDVHQRVMVIDISDTHDDLRIFINPKILSASGSVLCEEGCLSVPGIFDRVARAEQIQLTALDIHGRPYELNAQGLLAFCIQHEMDHLEGKVFIEYLSRLKQQRIVKKLKRQRQEVM